MPSFELDTRYTQRILRSDRICLSLAEHSGQDAKDVATPQDTSAAAYGRIEAEVHLSRLVNEGQIPENKPVLMISVQNVLSNLRCLAYLDKAGHAITVTGEITNGARPYHILGMTKNGELVVREFLFGRETKLLIDACMYLGVDIGLQP